MNITSEGSCVVRWDVLIRVKTYAEPSDKFFMVRPVMFALWSENWSFVRLKTLLRTLAKILTNYMSLIAFSRLG